MRKKTAWMMSESDTYELLNAIDERLSSSHLDERQHGVLIRLGSMLEDDLCALGRQPMMQSAGAGLNSATQPA